MKDVSSRQVMNAISAHGCDMRYNVMVNELLRVMRNCSIHLEWDSEAAVHLTYYMRRMQWSGYTVKERHDILKRALTKYDNRLRTYTETGTMFTENTKPKRRPLDWYKYDGKYDSVLFVEATPDSELKKKTERLVKKHKLKILVVERAGSTTRGVLQKSDPFRHYGCGRDSCVMCKNGSKTDCRTRGIVYQFECKEVGCGRKYRGTTGRSTFERTTEHVRDWTNGVDECPLKRHSVLFHDMIVESLNMG